MIVHIERENRTSQIRFIGKVSEMLELLRINPETVLVARNNELLAMDDTLSDEDEVNILSVISGG